MPQRRTRTGEFREAHFTEDTSKIRTWKGGAPLSVFLVAAIILIALYLYRASKSKPGGLLPNINVFPQRAPAGYPRQAAPEGQEPTPGRVPGIVEGREQTGAEVPLEPIHPIAPFTPAPVSPPQLQPLPPQEPSVMSPGGG